MDKIGKNDTKVLVKYPELELSYLVTKWTQLYTYKPILLLIK